MNRIPDKYRDLLDRPIVISLATLMKNGTQQVQPVWCSYDGSHILVNTAKGRAKYFNMLQRPQVTVLAIDPGDDMRWIEVRGRVVESTERGADAHIDELAKLYMGVDTYPFRRDGEVRVVFRIEPQRVVTIESSLPDLPSSG
jgi:PPOX class probable F420-dependent enzyme